jgi:DNA-binding Lrp family transcriptional regulator
MKEFGENLVVGKGADILDLTAQKVGRNGKTYTRDLRVVEFDKQVRDCLVKNPTASRREIAEELGVPTSRAANSVTRLQNFGIVPTTRRVSSIGINLDEVLYGKKKKEVCPIELKTPNNEIIEQDEYYDNKKLSDVMTPQQILLVRDRFIRDLLLNNTSMAEVMYFTRTTEGELRNTIARLIEKGELLSPHCPYTS